MTDTMLEQSYPGAGQRSTSAKTVLSCSERISAKLRSGDWSSQLVDLSPHNRNDPTGPVKLGKESPVKKDSLASGGHLLQLKTSPSAHSRHSCQRGGPARESGKPATIPRESSPAKSRIRYENHFNKLLIIVKKNKAKDVV